MIHARDLHRSFKTKAGPVEAVRGLSLDVAEGEMLRRPQVQEDHVPAASLQLGRVDEIAAIRE